MTQRNPMNDRYQTKDHQGQTRKSAASAKPKSKAAASVTMEKKKGAKGAKGSASAGQKGKGAATDKDAARAERARKRELRAKYYNPDTPEYHRWRAIWIGCLVGSFSFLALGWFGTSFMPTVATYISLGVAYALIFGAIYVDMAKLRKIRNAYAAEMEGKGKSKEERKAEKQAKAAERAAGGKGAPASPAQAKPSVLGKFFGRK